MSLNGLEAPQLNEAYQSALGEGGGWFLLKYISRDEVGLLERGSGGLLEVQEAVNRYEEQSPLFGFIQYRRRKVILKYVPEGTSRLLQARVSVQFQSVAEKLTPHDTIFPFTHSAELQDSALSSACSLHTAASVKSKDSSPHRGLAGITEDASESRIENDHTDRSPEFAKRGDVYVPRTSEDPQTRNETVNGRISAELAHSRSPSVATQSTYRPRTTSDTNKALPPPPEDYTLEDNATSLYNYGDHNTRPSVDERCSSQSARPSARDLHDAYEYKPKVKLGPRPSMDSQRGPDNSHRSNDFRPVSSLPAGLRMPARKVVSGPPVSRQAQSSPPERMSPKEMPPPLSKTPITPIQIPDRKLSAHSNGLPTSLKTPEPNTPKMTPEKRRLMKALQLRQKQLAAQKPVNGFGTGNSPEEQMSEVIKPEVDDAVLSAIIAAHGPKTEPDSVHVAVRDLSKEEPRNPEASPISIAETFEGPSTQASSITDEEDSPYHKVQDDNVAQESTMRESQDLLPQAAADGGQHMSGTETIRASEKGHETGVTNEAPLHSSLENSIPYLDRLLPEARNQERRDQNLEPEVMPVPADTPAKPTSLSLLANGNEISDRNHQQTAMAQSAPVISPDQSAAEVTHDSITETASQEDTIWQNTSANVQRQEPQTSRAIAPIDSQIKGNESSQISPLIFSEDPKAPVSTVSPHEVPLPIVNAEENDGLEHSNALSQTPIVSIMPQSSVPQDERANVEGIKKSALAAIVPKVLQTAVEKPLRDPQHGLTATSHGPEGPRPPLNEAGEGNIEPLPALLPAAPITQTPLRVETETLSPPLESKRRSQASDITATQPSSSNAVREPQTECSVRRQGVVNPLERMSSAEQSDEHFLSDDSFMEELNSATVQEAKPVSVSKSPIKPVFPRSDSQQRLIDTRSSRSVSTPIHTPRNNGEVSPSRRPPTSASIRSFSASHAPRPDEQIPPMPLPKKIGVSSGISQRIKALEQSRQTNRPISPQSQASTPSPAAFMNLRKNAQRSPPEATSLNRIQSTHTRPSTAYPSPSPSPDYVKWNPFSQSKKIGASRPESVSVTATIIRDATNKTPEMPVNPSEPRTMDLHQSPLTVERQEMRPPPPPPPLSPLKPPRPRYARYSSARSGSSSSTDHTQKLEKPPNSRRDSFASIRSKSSRAGSEHELPRSISDSSLGSPGSPGSPDDKKDSKRSRLLKRMSSISSMSRRSIAHALSPGPKEGPILESQEPIAEVPSASSVVEVGDVNVQFPDTLLWKRRHMLIDEQGVLVLAASKSDNNSKVITKRFALSQFRTPYIPDQDRQELPNSVILDFIDGSTLQCACEHPQGQAGVLQVLKQAHATWSR